MAASIIPTQTIVNYRGQALTIPQARYYVQQIDDLEKRYDAQKDVGTFLVEQNRREEEEIAGWFDYVEKDKARTIVTAQRFKEDWHKMSKIASRSRSQAEKMATARKSILEKWEERAVEMASAPAYNTLTKLRLLTRQHSFAEALPLINRAILLRIRHYTSINKVWKLGPQAVDYDRVRDQGAALPEFTLQELDPFKLFLDSRGVLRQEGRQGCILGMLPDTPKITRQIAALPAPATPPAPAPTTTTATATTISAEDIVMSEQSSDDDGKPEEDDDDKEPGQQEEQGDDADDVTEELRIEDRIRGSSEEEEDESMEDEGPLTPSAHPCGCSIDVGTAWHTAVTNQEHMKVERAIELLNESRGQEFVCNTHRRLLRQALGLRATNDKDLRNAINIVYNEQGDLWELKTGPYYKIFKKTKRPGRPAELLGTRRFPATAPKPTIHGDQLLEDLTAGYPIKMEAWKRHGSTALPGVLNWWNKTITIGTESTIVEIAETELLMYHHHATNPRGPLQHMRHSIFQQLI